MVKGYRASSIFKNVHKTFMAHGAQKMTIVSEESREILHKVDF
jgi:hypothetical protein